MQTLNRGISIIEILVASAIITISVIGIVTTLQSFLIVSLGNSDKAQAVLMLEESLEVVQYIRDKGWETNIEILDDETDYYINWNGSDYLITSTPQIEKNKFSRKLVFEEVYRDVDDDIAESGTLDAGTRKVLVTIDWTNAEGNQSVSSEFLIHDVYQN